MSTNGTNDANETVGSDPGVSTRGKAQSPDDRKLLATAGTEARRASFGPGGGLGMPAERSDKFGETLRRLGEILGTEKPRLFTVFFLTVVSVTLVVIGPKLLGEATNTAIVTSSKLLMNDSTQPPATPGRISGRVIRRKTVNAEAPRERAARSASRSRPDADASTSRRA